MNEVLIADPAAPPPPLEKRGIGPVEASERIELLDILRGFAIFGILVVNMLFFAGPIYWRIDSPWSFEEQLVEAFIAFFFQGKFYSLFSFLFGLGLAIQMLRAEERGVDFGRLYRRRLLILLMIGLVHAILIWYGDILHIYALLGFLLLLFHKRQPRTILIWAFITAMIPVVLFFLIGIFLDVMRSSPTATFEFERQIAERRVQGRLEADAAVETYREGSYGEVLQQRLKDLAATDSFALFGAGHIFALFLIGLYVGKRQIYRVQEYQSWIRRVWRWSLILGLIGGLGSLIQQFQTDQMAPSTIDGVYNMMHIFGAPALAFFYATSLVLAAQNPVWATRLTPIAAVGRMALSNYLLQSLICTTIFYSHGLAMFGRVPPSLGLLLAIVIYVLQIPLSIWWLRHFRFGPAEWLWRSLTYDRAQPMRA